MYMPYDHEHLKFGGQMLVIWLKQVLNSGDGGNSTKFQILHRYTCLQGEGQGSLEERQLYRGIALTPVIAKLLEFITLARLQPILEELGVPSRMQTAYRKHTSCDDSIFANLEVMSHYLAQEDQVMVCSFDLERPLTMSNMVSCCNTSLMLELTENAGGL